MLIGMICIMVFGHELDHYFSLNETFLGACNNSLIYYMSSCYDFTPATHSPVLDIYIGNQSRT